MTKLEVSSRPELRGADDAVIEDAVAYADPMVLRGLLYQLTGDPELEDIGVKSVAAGFAEGLVPAGGADVAMLQGKAADFLRPTATPARVPSRVGPREYLHGLGLMLEPAAAGGGRRPLCGGDWRSTRRRGCCAGRGPRDPARAEGLHRDRDRRRHARPG